MKTTIHDDGQTLNVSDTIITGDKNKVLGDNNTVVGAGNSVNGTYNHVRGDTDIVLGDHNSVHGNNMIVLGTNGVSGYGTWDPGHFNHVQGNNNLITGDDNVVRGDGNGIAGDSNIYRDVTGGKVYVSGDNNQIFASHSDTIKFLKGNGNELNFTGAKSGFTTVEGFVTGDDVIVGKNQTASLSSDAGDTTLTLHNAKGREYEVFFSNTTLATVQDSMHAVGHPGGHPL